MTVSDPLYGEAVEAEWNPWRELRQRRHLRLVWAKLTDCKGRLEDDGMERRVLLDSRLDQPGRNATLTHELIHDERNLLYLPDTPPGLVQREEETVNREVARRLVPPILLERLIDRLVELGEPVHAATVMEEFSVPLDVAHRALWMVEQRRAHGHTIGVESAG